MKMRHFGNMLGRMNQLEGDPLAMAAGREPSSFYNRDLVWHVGVNRIMRNTVDAGFGEDLTRFEFLGHHSLL